MAEGDHPVSDHQEQGTWDYRPDSSAAPVQTTGVSLDGSAPAHDDNDPNTINWTASEFIAHDKSPMWYVVLGLVTIGICSILYLITRDDISVGVTFLLLVSFGIAAARKPRIVNYRLDRGGLTIGKHFHPYGSFKSFAIVDEGAFASVTFIPLRRFSLPVSLYFSPEDERAILELTAKHLPLQPGALDALDRFMRSIHF